MGFPSICYGIVMPRPIVDLLDLWNHLKLMIRLVFFYMGLFDPTDTTSGYEPHTMPRRLSPQVLSPTPPPASPDTIKERLPVVQFAEFAMGAGICEDGDDEEEVPTCVICLSCLEGHHGVRKLSNCSHVFHMGCLDEWVDLGQVTCPLCRSALMPEEEKERMGTGKDSWAVERISYLFGEDLNWFSFLLDSSRNEGQRNRKGGETSIIRSHMLRHWHVG